MLHKKLFPIIIIFNINLKQYFNNKLFNINYSFQIERRDAKMRTIRIGISIGHFAN